jgi:SAM-dependent methyltransferase
MIAAYSPQARGRSERNFGTWQGRLPQELRLAGISSLEDANRFLREHYIEKFNAKFKIPAEQQSSAFRRCGRFGCGAGGCAVHLARTLGAEVIGIDVNESGIRNAQELARSGDLASRVEFKCIDVGERLPFDDGSFDAVFSNDAMCHIPHRLQTLEEWYRVLRPDGRMLFTDAMIVTGILSNEEIATRSSIGCYFFLPAGENERLIEEAGFQLLSTVNATQSAADISQRWFDARLRRSHDLRGLEGESTYSGLQQFLACVHTVAREERLSRLLYVASKPADADEAS